VISERMSKAHDLCRGSQSKDKGRYAFNAAGTGIAF
jgi:hypothetical protein